MGGAGRWGGRHACFLTGFFLGFFLAPISTDDAATRRRMVWCWHAERAGRWAGRQADGRVCRRVRVAGGRARRADVTSVIGSAAGGRGAPALRVAIARVMPDAGGAKAWHLWREGRASTREIAA